MSTDTTKFIYILISLNTVRVFARYPLLMSYYMTNKLLDVYLVDFYAPILASVANNMKLWRVLYCVCTMLLWTGGRGGMTRLLYFSDKK